MKRLLVFIVIVLIGVGILGYSRGWFDVSKEGGVAVDRDKFEKDKTAFNQMVSEKAKAMKDAISNLWKKSKLSDADKASAEKELKELEAKHDRLEAQLKELQQAGEQGFQTLKADLTKALEEVERRTEELTKKLQKKKTEE